jgi:opacity protein-like surface antigen
MNMMKTMAVGMLAAALLAGAAQADSAVSLSGRYQRAQPDFEGYPFADGDLSYMPAYEIHNDDALIQLGAGICPSFKENEALDYAVTPQANLLFKDRIFRAGLGVLSTYTKADDDDDWTDLYWQFLLGLSFQLPARLTIDVLAIYPFEQWDALSDFSADGIEYSAGLGWHF